MSCGRGTDDAFITGSATPVGVCGQRFKSALDTIKKIYRVHVQEILAEKTA